MSTCEKCTSTLNVETSQQGRRFVYAPNNWCVIYITANTLDNTFPTNMCRKCIEHNIAVKVFAEEIISENLNEFQLELDEY